MSDNNLNWNSAEPQGAFTPASSIDEEIRTGIKQPIDERMTAISNWPANGTRLFLLEGTARIHVGDREEFLETPPQFATGELFYIFDTKELFVGDVGEESAAFWTKIDSAGPHARYDETLAPGSKVVFHELPAKRLSIEFLAHVDSEGSTILDLNEFTDDTYSVAKIATIFVYSGGAADIFYSPNTATNQIQFFVSTLGHANVNQDLTLYVSMTFRP